MNLPLTSLIPGTAANTRPTQLPGASTSASSSAGSGSGTGDFQASLFDFLIGLGATLNQLEAGAVQSPLGATLPGSAASPLLDGRRLDPRQLELPAPSEGFNNEGFVEGFIGGSDEAADERPTRNQVFAPGSDTPAAHEGQLPSGAHPVFPSAPSVDNLPLPASVGVVIQTPGAEPNALRAPIEFLFESVSGSDSDVVAPRVPREAAQTPAPAARSELESRLLAVLQGAEGIYRGGDAGPATGATATISEALKVEIEDLLARRPAAAPVAPPVSNPVTLQVAPVVPNLEAIPVAPPVPNPVTPQVAPVVPNLEAIRVAPAVPNPVTPQVAAVVSNPEIIQLAPVVPNPVKLEIVPPVPNPTVVQVAPAVPNPVTLQVAAVVPTPEVIQVAPPVPNPVTLQVAPPVPNPVTLQVAAVVPNPEVIQVAPPVPNPVTLQVAAVVPNPEVIQVAPAVPNPVTPQVAPPVPNPVTPQVAPPVPNPVTPQVAPPVPNPVTPQVAPPVPNPVTLQVAPPVPNPVTPQVAPTAPNPEGIPVATPAITPTIAPSVAVVDVPKLTSAPVQAPATPIEDLPIRNSEAAPIVPPEPTPVIAPAATVVDVQKITPPPTAAAPAAELATMREQFGRAVRQLAERNSGASAKPARAAVQSAGSETGKAAGQTTAASKAPLNVGTPVGKPEAQVFQIHELVEELKAVIDQGGLGREVRVQAARTGQSRAATRSAVAQFTSALGDADESVKPVISADAQTVLWTSSAAAAAKAGQVRAPIDVSMPTQIREAADFLLSRVDGTVTVNGDGEIKAELRLFPPDLGRIRVELTMTEGRTMQARFIAELSGTGDVLRQNLHHFSEALARQGVNVDRIIVDVEPRAVGQSGTADNARNEPRGKDGSAREQAQGSTSEHHGAGQESTGGSSENFEAWERMNS